MDATLLDQLEQTLQQVGPAAAIDKLAAELKAKKDDVEKSGVWMSCASPIWYHEASAS